MPFRTKISLQNRSGLLLQLGLVILTIFLLASSISELTFKPGESHHLLEIFLQGFTGAFEMPASGDGVATGPTASITILRLMFWGCLLFAIIYAFISPQYRRILLRVAILVALFMFFMNRIQEREGRSVDVPEFGSAALAEEEPLSLPEPPQFVADTPEWLFTTVNIVLGLLMAAILWYVWRRFQNKPEEAEVEWVTDVQRALHDLDAGGDLKDVILRCYAEMSQTLRREQNLTRRHGMTPREFAQQLAHKGLADEHIQRLTNLFESVRYGAITPGERQEREARDCLRAIVDVASRNANVPADGLYNAPRARRAPA